MYSELLFYLTEVSAPTGTKQKSCPDFPKQLPCNHIILLLTSLLHKLQHLCFANSFYLHIINTCY